MNIDQKLITDCINRKSTAEYELYKITYSYLMSICIRYTKSEDRAKEVLNIGFHRVLKYLAKYQPEVPFKSWIRKVMINTLINEFRKEKIHYRNLEYVDSYFDTNKHADINEAITRFDVKEIYRLIAKLPLVNQQIFNLYFIDGYKHREIAEMLNINENTCKWHLTVAKEKLKEMINKMDVLIKAEK
ncbi:MAG: sigma-70 family RNA polymerase sigma factor [Bacteroidota bacterium]